MSRESFTPVEDRGTYLNSQRTPSLRTGLVLKTGVGAALVLVAACTLLYFLVSRALWTAFDEALASKARSLAIMIEQEHGRLELDFHEIRLLEFEPSIHSEVYEIWRHGDQVIARSHSLQGHDLTRCPETTAETDFCSITLPDGRPGRVVTMKVVPRIEDSDQRVEPPLEVALALGHETTGILGTLKRIRLAMASVCVAAVIVTASFAAVSVKRGLKPVARLCDRIAEVDASKLPTQIPPMTTPQELLPIVGRVNDLLNRLDTAFERERRFTGDVAHELRTPLAGLRAKLEVALSRDREHEEYRHTLHDCGLISLQMQRMVESLLHLARADAGQLRMQCQTVNVAMLLRECWQSFARLAQDRGVRVKWSLEEPCCIGSDRDHLGLVLRNVLENATAYVDQNGRITIGLASTQEHVRISTSNTGCLLDQQDIQRVFDRFWRADPSRTTSAGSHTGLGLSLAKTIIELLDGSISAELAPGGEFAITILLPLSPKLGSATYTTTTDEESSSY